MIKTIPPSNSHEASFRDPSGFVIQEHGVIKRVINPIYFPQYNKLTSSGFFNKLIKAGLLIPHQEIENNKERIVIQPETIPFITNPYEWSFEMYKHAALHTLKIHRFALANGFILKDASAYNITFHKGKPIFIDTLSFDFYEEDTPWRAFKQFITHFFGPLLLAKYHGVDMLKMMQTHIDGIPVKTIASLLPLQTKFNSILYTNIHLLAKLEDKYSEDYKAESKISKLSKKAQNNIIESLYDSIKKLKVNQKTEWGDYYKKTNYNDVSFQQKARLIKEWTTALKAKTVIDVGGNDGTFGREITEIADIILVSDIDANAVDFNYHQIQKNKESNILPFVCDILQPAPAIGFNNTERSSLIERLKAFQPDLTMALALIHHITLSGNVPFVKSAEFFASFSKNLILEFPTREDSWVQSLLIRKREFINHFDFYNEENFEMGYSKFFEIVKKEPINASERILYLLKRK
ncbi:MAG: class I SAM-dependent methyltransferase [Flavobacteriaceae bacterium]